MFNYSEIQDEVKRRATIDQSGSQFTTAVKNTINFALSRVSREALWRPLRRKTTFDTIGAYTTGSGGGTFTNDSKNITVAGATFITDNIKVGQRVKLQGGSKIYTIKTITGETTFTIDQNYAGETITGTGTYKILGQEEYNLPIQTSHRMFIWHENFGHPYLMDYVTDQDFVHLVGDNTSEADPTHYRMWGQDMVIDQPIEASVVTVASSDSSDTNITITVFGTVSGYPDYEEIVTNSSDGTTSSAGSKSFSSIERIAKSNSTTGRITATANTGNTTVAVLPVGDTTNGVLYSKLQLYPLPDSIIPINVYYYKEPYRLVNSNDVHELGGDFDEAIILLAVAKLKYEQNQNEGEKFFGLYIDEIKNLKKTNVDKIDWIPTFNRPNHSRKDPLVHPNLRLSQFGSSFGIRVR